MKTQLELLDEILANETPESLYNKLAKSSGVGPTIDEFLSEYKGMDARIHEYVKVNPKNGLVKVELVNVNSICYSTNYYEDKESDQSFLQDAA